MFGRWFWIFSGFAIGLLFLLTILRVVIAVEITLCLLVAAVGSVIIERLDALRKRLA